MRWPDPLVVAALGALVLGAMIFPPYARWRAAECTKIGGHVVEAGLFGFACEVPR